MALSPRTAPVALAFFLALGVLIATTSIDAQTPRRSLFVSVTDKSGTPVPGLGPSDFIVREDKMTREVLDVAPADTPMQIVLLVDNSQAADPYIRDYREALTVFIEAITKDPNVKGKHQIAIVGLAARPTIVRDYTSDQVQLTKGAQSIFSMPQTGTYLLDGIIETTQGITKRSAPRPVLVAIVTEGPDLSDRPYNVVLRPLRDSGAVLHVVRVGSPMNTTHDRAVVIDEGTKTTGGRYDEILTSTALKATLARLATDLTNQYRVTYARPQTLVPPESVAVSVSKPGLTARGTPVKEDRAQERR